jgi:hypothetical protein
VKDGAIYGPKPEAVTFADFAGEFLRVDSPQKRSKDRDEAILGIFKALWKGRLLTEITRR